MFQIAQTGAAILFRHGDAEQAEPAHLLPQIGGKNVGTVDFGRARRNLVGRKGTDAVADHVRCFAEIEVE
jgi:hypothetical protein